MRVGCHALTYVIALYACYVCVHVCIYICAHVYVCVSVMSCGCHTLTDAIPVYVCYVCVYIYMYICIMYVCIYVYRTHMRVGCHALIGRYSGVYLLCVRRCVSLMRVCIVHMCVSYTHASRMPCASWRYSVVRLLRVCMFVYLCFYMSVSIMCVYTCDTGIHNTHTGMTLFCCLPVVMYVCLNVCQSIRVYECKYMCISQHVASHNKTKYTHSHEKT